MSKPQRGTITTTENKDGVTHVATYTTENDSLVCVATVRGSKVTRTFYTQTELKAHIKALKAQLA